MKDTRNPIPQAANQIIDDAKFSLALSLRYSSEILSGGLTEAEIYRRVGLMTAKAHETISLLVQAQNVGRNNRKDE